MKGIILAGGNGTRLRPMTKVTNKHLLPVYDRPMIYWPLQTLVGAGIKKILIVTGTESAGDFLKLLGSGREFGVELTYRLQDETGGIAHALGLAEDFVGDEKATVILGDNIFRDNIRQHVKEFEGSSAEAAIFLKGVSDANRFGIAELDEVKRVIGIEEKPESPKSNYAVTGLYMYTPSVFEIIKNLKPSARGELEITDVNNEYVRRKALDAYFLEGGWSDAGTIESLARASELVKSKTDE
jgi:glucose-1-phosphate thymidylyltransferase